MKNRRLVLNYLDQLEGQWRGQLPLSESLTYIPSFSGYCSANLSPESTEFLGAKLQAVCQVCPCHLSHRSIFGSKPFLLALCLPVLAGSVNASHALHEFVVTSAAHIFTFLTFLCGSNPLQKEHY